MAILEAVTPAAEKTDMVFSLLGSALSTVTRYVLVELSCAVTIKSTVTSSEKLYVSPLPNESESTSTVARGFAEKETVAGAIVVIYGTLT